VLTIPSLKLPNQVISKHAVEASVVETACILSVACIAFNSDVH
jgi:hypothetical protein